MDDAKPRFSHKLCKTAAPFLDGREHESIATVGILGSASRNRTAACAQCETWTASTCEWAWRRVRGAKPSTMALHCTPRCVTRIMKRGQSDGCPHSSSEGAGQQRAA